MPETNKRKRLILTNKVEMFSDYLKQIGNILETCSLLWNSVIE